MGEGHRVGHVWGGGGVPCWSCVWGEVPCWSGMLDEGQLVDQVCKVRGILLVRYVVNQGHTTSPRPPSTSAKHSE